MSIPAINVYTHGTHITVAHTMGTTIGINSFLLFSFIFDAFKIKNTISAKRFSFAYFTVNISLFIFLIALISAGILKADWQMNHPERPFTEMMNTLKPAFIIFFLAGAGLASGFLIIIYKIVKFYRDTNLS